MLQFEYTVTTFSVAPVPLPLSAPHFLILWQFKSLLFDTVLSLGTFACFVVVVVVIFLVLLWKASIPDEMGTLKLIID